MKTIYAILLSLIMMPMALADGLIDLPDLGDVSATVLTPQQEQKIADQIMRDVMSSGDVVEDSEINDYVQNLGYKLASSGPDKLQHFNFFVVEDNTINAFAMPGGVVGVHTGLIVAAESESELASVLGHEIGHVVQHHMARMMALQKQDSILSIGMFALAILAARANPQLGGGALTTASASGIQKQLDYTRDNEREADRVGMQILQNAGFDVHAMPAFFEVLQKGTRFSDGGAPAFLRSHPVTSERIADVKGRADQVGFSVVKESEDFQYIRVKLIASLGSPADAVSVFKNSLLEKQYTDEASQHYGLALAYLRNNDPAGAARELAWLRANAPLNAIIETLACNIAVARKNALEAGKQYLAALTIFPSHRALIYGYAEHLLELGQTEDALKFIDDRQSQFPDDPYFYELKSRAYTTQGKNQLRHHMQGEAYLRRYDLPKAIEQMDLAVKTGTGDFYEQSIVESRLKELKQQVDEPKKKGWFD